MIVLINGSFGVGKTTIARRLRKELRGSAIYDPEWAGIGLMRLKKWIKFRGSETDDFQDIDLWRKCAVWGVRLWRSVATGPVIVPMTFSRRDYFDEVTAGVRQAEASLRVFCLHASQAAIADRLAARRTNDADARWITRRNLECADAHRDPHFGEPVDTNDRAAAEVASEILRRLKSN